MTTPGGPPGFPGPAAGHHDHGGLGPLEPA